MGRPVTDRHAIVFARVKPINKKWFKKWAKVHDLKESPALDELFDRMRLKKARDGQ